jgi:hypothetical protein
MQIYFRRFQPKHQNRERQVLGRGGARGLVEVCVVLSFLLRGYTYGTCNLLPAPLWFCRT